MIHRDKIQSDWSRRRTRYDPPGIDDAVAAAQGLTDHIDSQIEIAAQLIGLPEDEVRPAVLKAAADSRTPDAGQTATRHALGRTVVIERRSTRVRLTGAGHR